MDLCAARLRDSARSFAALSIDRRLELLRAARSGYARTVPRSVVACCRAKRIILGTPLEAEEWFLGPWPVMRHFRLLIEALSALRRRHAMPLGDPGRTVDGRLSVEVFPGSTLDSLLLPATRAEVHMRAGIGDREVLASQGAFYKRGLEAGSVVLVLGGGTAAGAPIQDVLTKMFNEGKVCLLKLHPLNAYLGPLVEEAFAEAIARNFLQVVYGGWEAGSYLGHHPAIDEIHISGAPETLEQVPHGKVITSELGGVAPVLIVPGPYLDRQLAFQAQALAGAMVHNAAVNCHTPRLLVTPRGWTQRDAFLRHLEEALALAPLRMAYYPGTAERWEELTARRTGLRTIGARVAGMLPWTIIPELDPTSRWELLFTSASYCPVLGEVAVGSTDPLDYLHQAIGFVNERVWGTLSATIIVHPLTQADTRLATAVERAIAQLRYGAVGVNAWPALLSAIGSAPWGAHPSSDSSHVQSGLGWVHNTAMLEEVEKAVIRQPITLQLRPAYVPGHRSAAALLRRLTAVERGAGWAGLPGVLEAAIRS